MRRVFDRQGLGWVLRVPELTADIAVRRLTRSHGDMTGEITVSCALPGTRSSDGHLHQARFNLSSTSARATLAKTLTQRADVPNLDWADLLEDFCRRVLAAEREGAPVVRVGTLPRPASVSWRLDPMVPIGKPVILLGEGGSGKSTLAAAFAISVETGVALVPGIIPRRGTSLYLDWEDDADTLNGRVAELAAGANIADPVTIAYRSMAGVLADQAERIAEIVAALSIDFLIVDSVGLAAGTSSDGADAAESALRLFAALRVIELARAGVAFLLIDHVSKAEAEIVGRGARPYGSIYKVNLARALFEIRRSERTIGIFNTKSNVRSLLAPMAYVVHHESGSIEYEATGVLPATMLARKLTVGDAIADLLEAVGHMAYEDIATRLGRNPDVVRSTLNRDKARFGKLPSGQWELLPSKPASSAGVA